MDNSNYQNLISDKNINLVYELQENDILHQLVNLEQLTFEVTDACNLKCKYCGYGELYNTYDKRNNSFMNFSMAKKVIDYLYAIWQKYPGKSSPRKIVFGFYGGEPLMNFTLIQEVISYLETLPPIPNTQFGYNMTTNAILLDKYMAYLAEKEFRLLISLDGNEYNHSYRTDHNGNPSFSRVYKNVKLLMDTYPEYFRQHVDFNAVLHNRSNLRQVKDFIRNEFGKTPSMSELDQFGVCKDKKETFDQMYHSIAGDVAITDKDFNEVYPDTSGLYRFTDKMSGNFFSSHNLLLRKGVRTYQATGTCRPFEKKVFVTVNGKILPCEKIDQKFVLGKVTDTGIELDLQKIADIYTRYYQKVKPLCEKCYMKHFCAQCMFYMEDLDGKVKCPQFANKQKMEDMINHYSTVLYYHPELYKKVSQEMLFRI